MKAGYLFEYGKRVSFIVLLDEEMIPSFSINIKGRRAGSCEPTYEKENIKITCSVLFL